MLLINNHSDISIKARGLMFGTSLHLHPFFVYGRSEGSSKSVLADAKTFCDGPINEIPHIYSKI